MQMKKKKGKNTIRQFSILAIALRKNIHLPEFVQLFLVRNLSKDKADSCI